MAEGASAAPHTTARPPQELIVLAGVVGSGKSSLSSRWIELLPGYSILVDRQNFDAPQRRTWLEIAGEFNGVQVGGLVMNTSEEECRERLLVRDNHPTIDNPNLAVELLDKFSSLWVEPALNEGFDQLITLPSLPPPSEIDAALILSLLDKLHSAPLNPSGKLQRIPRPREPYRRPDGFIDDGTWRPPPPAARLGTTLGGVPYGPGYQTGGRSSGGMGYPSGGAGGSAGGGAGAGAMHGYRPPTQGGFFGSGTYGGAPFGGQAGWQPAPQQQYGQQPYAPQQGQPAWGGGRGGYGGRGRGGGSAGSSSGGHQWGAGRTLGGP
ncbi:hypothetical protein JCM10213v2_005679 [Rhodosporidiobolus nylandii]